jgi:Polyketide cyclase / dehydrase and lipid transport
MIANANVTKILNVPSDRVWAAIKSVGGLDQWFPIIATCKVEGAGVGAIRILELAGGGEMRDRIIEIADRERRLRYDRFQLPFPVAKYFGTVEVRNRGDSQSEISWSIQMDVDADKKDELNLLIQSAISDGIDGLERELRGS